MARQLLTAIDVLGAYADHSTLPTVTFTAARNTAIDDEVLTNGHPGAGVVVTGTLANAPVRPGSLIITDAGSTQVIVDDAEGLLIGDTSNTPEDNTINYETGEYRFAFASAVTGTVTADYRHTGSEYVCVEREMVLVKNAAGSAKQVTAESQPSARTNRTKDILDYSIAAGATIVLPDLRQDGWASEDRVWLDVQDENIQFAVLRRP